MSTVLDHRTPRALALLLLPLSLAARPAQAGPGPTPPPLTSPDGRRQVTAVAAQEPVRLDGALDDEVWRRAQPVGGFVQSEPREGEPATEQTEVRVAYDAQNLYVAALCRDSDPSALVVNDIRKDFTPGDQDSFEVVLDTFADRRNGYVFATNPRGARSDQQMANEGRETNASWDAVWSVRTSIGADGWTVEMAIPFRTLRFAGGRAHEWGINFSRRIRRKNEVTFWSPVPRAYGLSRVSLAGDLVGLPALDPGRNLRLKPYVAASAVRPAGDDDYEPAGDVGLDLKYGVTPALALDLTVNPDFAQAEADEQQVNLTQFSLFFPEKRDFFLENSGIFYVGDAARNNRLNPTPTPDEDLLLFFSRRIGLTDEGTPIPILAGGRLTGHAGGFGLGLLTVQTRRTEEEPANNYAVVRLRHDVGRSSDVGAIFMSRQSTDDGGDYNRVFGLDSTLRLLGNVDWNSYAVGTATPGFGDGQYAWRTSLNREGNFFHGKGGVMSIGEGFNDEIGYVRRVDTRKWFLDTGIRPRFASLQRRGIREMHPHLTWAYYTDLGGRISAKNLHTGYTLFFNDGGYLELSANPKYERLLEPFEIDPRAEPIPPGGYGWNEWMLRGQTDLSRPIGIEWTAISGGLWSGTQRTIQAQLTVRASYHFRASLGLQRTSARLASPVGSVVETLWTLRANYSFNTNMFLDGLLQFDETRRLFSANVRFNLIHRPLSDLFVVYNEERYTSGDVRAGRGLILKFTRMMAF